MREYELMFLVDPRLTDDEVVALTDQYREMIQSAGGDVYREESWGKKRMAYSIEKLSEANYVVFHVRSEGGSAFQEVEQRMRQNEQVLRYLTVRTDAGRLRISRPDEEDSGDREAEPSEESTVEEDE